MVFFKLKRFKALSIFRYFFVGHGRGLQGAKIRGTNMENSCFVVYLKDKYG